MGLFNILDLKINIFNETIPSADFLKEVLKNYAEPFEKVLLNFVLKTQFIFNSEKTYEDRIVYMTKLFDELKKYLPDTEKYTEDDYLIYMYYSVFCKDRNAKDQDILNIIEIFNNHIMVLNPSSECEEYLKEELKHVLLMYENAIFSNKNIDKIQMLLEELKNNKDKQDKLAEKYFVSEFY